MSGADEEVRPDAGQAVHHHLEYVDSTRARCACGWNYRSTPPPKWVARHTRLDHVLDMYLKHIKPVTEPEKS